VRAGRGVGLALVAAAVTALGARHGPSQDGVAPQGLEAILNSYEANPRDVALPPDELRPLLDLLRAKAPAWVADRGAAEVARRRLAVATFVLDALRTDEDPLLWSQGQPASDLLEWACSFLRQGPPPRPGVMSGERLWDLASVAILERVGGSSAPEGKTDQLVNFSASEVLERHLISHAMSRVPDEPRLNLALGVALELRTWPEWRDVGQLKVAPALSAAIGGAYQRASLAPAVRQEALLRWGVFELRLGLTAKALEHFSQAGDPKDPIVGYWLHLFTGRALERTNRRAAAIASYEAALSDVPSAEAATFALGAALMADHRAAQAAVMVSRNLASPAVEDPWLIYTFPDSRYLPDVMRALRAQVAR
jgi:hypothetical protein